MRAALPASNATGGRDIVLPLAASWKLLRPAVP